MKRSIILLSIACGLILTSCVEDIQEPKKKIQIKAYTEGDDPLPPPIGGND